MIDDATLARFSLSLFFILLILIGLRIIYEPVFNSSFGWRINFGEHHVAAGVALASIGGYLLYLTVRKRDR